MLLTDEEIEACAADDDGSDDIAFARAIEAAILAKLASAKLPEPFDKQYDEIDREEFGIYGEGQLIAWGNTRFAQGAAAQLAEKPEAYGCRTADGVVRDCVGPDSVFANERQYTVPLYTRRQA